MKEKEQEITHVLAEIAEKEQQFKPLSPPTFFSYLLRLLSLKACSTKHVQIKVGQTCRCCNSSRLVTRLLLCTLWGSTPNALFTRLQCHPLTVILCTLGAADYVFIRIAILHFHSEQNVLKGSLWINLNIGYFGQSVCHGDRSFTETAEEPQTRQRSTDGW